MWRGGSALSGDEQEGSPLDGLIRRDFLEEVTLKPRWRRKQPDEWERTSFRENTGVWRDPEAGKSLTWSRNMV